MITNTKNRILFYLDKLTELSGIDLRYVVKGSYWSTVDLVIANSASLLLAMAFTRLLPKEIYGTYSFVLSYAGIFSTFAISGITGVITRSIAKGFEGDLQRSLKYKMQWGLVSSTLSLAFAIYYLMAGNNTLAMSFGLVAVLLPSYTASTVVSSYFFAKELFKYNSIVGISVKATSLVVMVFTMFFTKSVPIIILAYFVPDQLIRFCFLRWAIKKYQKNKETSPDMNIFAMHFTAMNILGGISKRLDSILLFHYIGAAELAIYRFAQLPMEKMQSLIGIMMGPGVPRFAKRDYGEIYPLLGKKLIWFNMLVLVIATCLFILLPFAFKILFPQYMESVYYARLLILTMVFSAPAVIHGIWQAKIEIKKLYVLKIITHVSRIAIFPVLIPLYGISGAIWSQVAISFFAGFYIYIMYLKEKAHYLKMARNSK